MVIASNLESPADVAAARGARLLANWLIAHGAKLMHPVDSGVAPRFAAALFGDCSHLKLPFMEDAPVMCNKCRKQVGTIFGLAVGVDAVHQGCEYNWRVPPWYAIYGFSYVSEIIFPSNSQHVSLLQHYIIMEYLAYEQQPNLKHGATTVEATG